jgi:hypothetical protein
MVWPVRFQPDPGPTYLLLAAVCLGCGLSEIPVMISPADAAPVEPPGVGVVIDGTAVPRDRALVFLHIGHSNMAGRSETPTSERPFFYDTHPNLWAYARGGVWRPAREPLSGDSMTEGRAGPGMAILRGALALAPAAHVISIGRGQSGQNAGYCRSFRRGGLLYHFVMDAAMELRGRVTFAAVFVMFGISEVDDMANARTFGSCAQGVVSDMREDLGEPALPFVFGDWEQEVETDIGPDSRIAQIIIPQLRSLPAQLTRTVLIETAGLPIEVGDHHYTLVGQKLWAQRGFDKLVAAGLAPWARPR